MSTTQIEILIQVFLAAVSSAAFLHYWSSRVVLVAVHDAVTYVAPRLAFSSLTVVLGVLLVGNLRFLSPSLTNPLMGRRHPALDIFNRYLQNTQEQFILHAVAVAAMAAYGQYELIDALVNWFVFARVAFLAGYVVEPRYRAFGFAATYLPAMVCLIFCAYRSKCQIYTGRER